MVMEEKPIVHTISICCSPLISMASTLSSEQGMEGKVTSNCIYTYKMDEMKNKHQELICKITS